MRASQTLIPTSKDTPAEAEIISHRLMLRAGLIRKLASGLYTWMPLGFRVLQKVEAIVRDEMRKTGAQEIMMPVVQPGELWEESGRWGKMGKELLKFHDRHERDFCLGPTHEEVVTDIIRNEVSSYRQLPCNLFQIQTKFRDEVRPRFGLMRAREFTMKDAYSFHASDECLAKEYDSMHAAYCAIFTRLKLDFRAVLADTGAIGGNNSHEFHVLAQSGEDAIAFSADGTFAANIEKTPAPKVLPAQQYEGKAAAIDTANARTIDELSKLLELPSELIVKTLIVEGATQEHPLVALCIRGDHELNEIKAEKHELIKAPLTFAGDEAMKAAGIINGAVGPCDLDLPIVADHSALALQRFVCGANEKQRHSLGATWPKNVEAADLRNALEGDQSPDGKSTLSIKRGIEVGHIFQLGSVYSEKLGASVLDENGKSVLMQMGCYGIGVSRIVAAAIEQNHDEQGIIWPEVIAPVQLAIIPINLHKSERVSEFCEALYHALLQRGVEVILFDEAKARLGGMLADVELIGIPHRVVIGDKGLDKAEIEYRHRRADSNEILSANDPCALADTLYSMIEKALEH